MVVLPGGSSLPAYVPYDDSLCGLPLFLQTIEIDSDAQHGLSFTPGLELVFGH